MERGSGTSFGTLPAPELSGAGEWASGSRWLGLEHPGEGEVQQQVPLQGMQSLLEFAVDLWLLEHVE